MKICFHVKFMVKRSQLSVFNALQMKRRLEWIVRKHALTAVSSLQDYCKQAFIVVRSSDIGSVPNIEIQSLFGIPLRPPLFYVPGHAYRRFELYSKTRDRDRLSGGKIQLSTLITWGYIFSDYPILISFRLAEIRLTGNLINFVSPAMKRLRD